MSLSTQTQNYSNTICIADRMVAPIGSNLGNSLTQTKAPTIGGLAYNTDDGTICVGTATGWKGTVLGPDSSTDNALVRFDGVTGNSTQNSVILANDAGDLSNIRNITNTGTIASTGNISSNGNITANGTINNGTINLSNTGAISGVTNLNSNGSINNGTINLSNTGAITGVTTINGLPPSTGTNTGNNSGDVTLAPFGSVSNANGASLSGQILTLQPANATNPGGVSTAAQTLAGPKTFSSATTFNSATTCNAPITVPDGTKNAPSLQLTNHVAGLYYHPSANCVAIGSGAADRLITYYRKDNILAGLDNILFTISGMSTSHFASVIMHYSITVTNDVGSRICGTGTLWVSAYQLNASAGTGDISSDGINISNAGSLNITWAVGSIPDVVHLTYVPFIANFGTIVSNSISAQIIPLITQANIITFL